MTIDLSDLITAEDKLNQAKQAKIVELSDACKQAILAGFDSDALGNMHHYPAQPEDQTNLLGRVIQAQMNANTPGWTVTFACADANGVWDKPAHTAQQMIAVGVAGAQDVEAKTNRYTALATQAMQVAGTDTAALAAITWSYP